MRRISNIILSITFALCGFAQQLEIASPLMHEASVGAANVPTDNNGNPCAKIIIEAPIDGIEIEGSYIVGDVVKSTGKYELYVATPKKQGRRITLLHDAYGSLDIDLWTNDGALVGREAYRVKLKPIQDDKFIVDMHGNRIDVEDKKVEVIVHEDAGGQYLVMNVSPSDVTVIIDNQFAKVENSGVTKFLNYGKHSYKVEHPMYEPKSGTFEIGNEKINLDIELSPIFGYIHVSSTPESGADVYIDGEKVGSTPFKTSALKEGEHSLRLIKEMYEMHDQSVHVERNKTINLDVEMKPTYGNVTISCANAAVDLVLNGKELAKGTWTGRLDQGRYQVEAKLPNHRTVSQSIDITSNSSAKFEIDAPQPIVGSLNLTSNPSGANMWIDGKDMGKTPNIINNLLIGSHTIKLSYDGYSTYEANVNIEEGKVTPMEVALDAGKQITIATDRVGDKIFVDGQLAGESPLNISLSFGKHKVFAMRGSDKTIEESIDISQATTAKQFHLNFGPIELTVKGVKFEVIPVVGGTFKMGSIESNSNDNERPVHNVTLTDFYIGRTEVTQALWEAVMGNNPSKWKDDKLPVNQVSWNDCKEFIAKLNKLTGRTFRLPTEAEWEYAARGGCKSRGYNYSGDKKIGKVAWYENNSKSKNEKAAAVALQILAASTKQNIGEINVERKTHFVGEKQPNELGIYDMSGNVWEWCSDWYGPYNLADQYNPTGIENGNHRVLRGGGLHSREKDCRVSCRIDCAPDIANEGFGLRLVLDI